MRSAQRYSMRMSASSIKSMVAIVAVTLLFLAPGATGQSAGWPAGCGGYWAEPGAECSFQAQAGLPIWFGGFAVAPDVATITVEVLVDGIVLGLIIGTCSDTGTGVAYCTGATQAPPVGASLICRVTGHVEGMFGCQEDP